MNFKESCVGLFTLFTYYLGMFSPILAQEANKKRATTAALMHLDEKRAGAQYFSITTVKREKD